MRSDCLLFQLFSNFSNQTTRRGAETRRRGDAETRRRRDAEERRRGDAEMRRSGDAETQRRGDVETRRRRDAEVQRQLTALKRLTALCCWVPLLSGRAAILKWSTLSSSEWMSNGVVNMCWFLARFFANYNNNNNSNNSTNNKYSEEEEQCC